jgi:hypothetical protein
MQQQQMPHSLTCSVWCSRPAQVDSTCSGGHQQSAAISLVTSPCQCPTPAGSVLPVLLAGGLSTKLPRVNASLPMRMYFSGLSPYDLHTAWHSTAQHSTAQHSTARHSVAPQVEKSMSAVLQTGKGQNLNLH